MENKKAYIILAHGSEDAGANDKFLGFSARLASRLPAEKVVPSFFQFADPSLEQVVDWLVGEGVFNIKIVPYFLHNGKHLKKDLPDRVRAVLKKYSTSINIEILSSLCDDIMLEDLLVDRIGVGVSDRADLPVLGEKIEARSHDIISRRLDRTLFTYGEKAVVRRVIHATADFSFAESIRVQKNAISRGTQALKEKAPVICDSSILVSGITKTQSEIKCAIKDEDVFVTAKKENTTRAVAAMRKLSKYMDNSIIAIGNAPTALWEVIDMCNSGHIKPALVVGIPVGFVGALESKTALYCSEIPYITNLSPKGGSTCAAAAVNALAVMALQGK
jgi:precorrin-8X/cobalt-precorrin-8 methylmutase